MQAHINHIKMIADQLTDVDDEVAEKDLVYILLSSVPDTYHNLITTIETLSEEKLSWEYVTDRLLHEFERRKESRGKKSSTDSALFAGNLPPWKKNQQKKGGKGYSEQGKTDKKCFHCHEKGHIKRDCPKLKEEKDTEDAKIASGKFSNLQIEHDLKPEFASSANLKNGLKILQKRR